MLINQVSVMIIKYLLKRKRLRLETHRFPKLHHFGYEVEEAKQDESPHLTSTTVISSLFAPMVSEQMPWRLLGSGQQ
ncbi:hypothetical protein TNIN_5351 [Trichonephila inaurata madagascariensis]|uniref:Uncharacterized protein n=1 Tax=Trichonephila inaurata madagascariensis TaxID=2747483 RepID=A0A8X7CQX4_9ARAC|nr:hypothetical protein TNIN_5351 [Trichonephila inaurata madagascariensis]